MNILSGVAMLRSLTKSFKLPTRELTALILSYSMVFAGCKSSRTDIMSDPQRADSVVANEYGALAVITSDRDVKISVDGEELSLKNQREDMDYFAKSNTHFIFAECAHINQIVELREYYKLEHGKPNGFVKVLQKAEELTCRVIGGKEFSFEEYSRIVEKYAEAENEKSFWDDHRGLRMGLIIGGSIQTGYSAYVINFMKRAPRNEKTMTLGFLLLAAVALVGGSASVGAAYDNASANERAYQNYRKGLNDAIQAVKRGL